MAATAVSIVSMATSLAVTPKPIMGLRSRTFGSRICLSYQNKKRNAFSLVVRATATPEELKAKVKESIANAEEVCDGGSTGECAAAWDEVEEISAAAADASRKLKEQELDPLEKFCLENPESDECRVYED